MRSETAGFEKAAGEYERARPGYPADAVAWITGTAGLGPGKTVVDLAAGTGKLTRELVSSGADVIAVEPLGEMRARLSELVPGVTVVEGLAEATGLDDGCADAVTVAQAFHWFSNDEALAEIQRILRPSGLLFLIWNKRDLSDRVQASISALTAPYIGDAPSYADKRWEEVMESTSRFEPAGEHSCTLTQALDRRGLVERVASTSYIAMLPAETKSLLLSEIGALAPEKGTVDLPYLTKTYAFKRL